MPLSAEILGTPLGCGQFVVVCCDVGLSKSRLRQLRDAVHAVRVSALRLHNKARPARSCRSTSVGAVRCRSTLVDGAAAIALVSYLAMRRINRKRTAAGHAFLFLKSRSD